VLDTNAFDALIASGEVAARVLRLCGAGAVRFETSEVQEAELRRLRSADRDKHRRADRVPRLVVAAEPAGGDAPRHRRDARIAATALRDGRTLVTDDGALRERAEALGVRAWSAQRLIDELGRLDGGAR
jgi:predicted nucleic acid-binding protein